MSREIWIALLCVAGAINVAGADTPKGYHEIARFPIGGDGGWDYLTVDSVDRRIYIARSDRMLVLDADSGVKKAEVPGLQGAHGVALDRQEGLGFVTSGKSGEVVVFDLKTFLTKTRVRVGENPDAIVFDPASKRVLAFNGKSKSASIIDPVSLKVTATVALDGKPEFAAADGSGHVFVNLEDKNQLAVLDPIAAKVTATHALAPCEEPTGLSMDETTHRLLVGCGNHLAAAVDASTGKVVATFKVGGGVDATAVDATRGLGFVSAGEGSLSIFREGAGGFETLQEVTTVPGARTLAEDSKTGHIFLPSARFGPSQTAPQAGGHSRPSVLPGSFFVLVVGTE